MDSQTFSSALLQWEWEKGGTSSDIHSFHQMKSTLMCNEVLASSLPVLRNDSSLIYFSFLKFSFSSYCPTWGGILEGRNPQYFYCET